MRILIVRNTYNTKAVEASLLLETYLATQDISYVCFDSDEIEASAALIDDGAVTDNAAADGQEVATDQAALFDMAVALGGDGTILRTAAFIKHHRVPILGINFGNLGFMANPSEEGVIPIVSAALAGDVTIEKRANLLVDAYCAPLEESQASLDDDLAEEPTKRFFALNEVVIARGTEGRMIDFSYAVDGSSMGSMRGDGVVVATATGSTAYALSAGGPLIAPGFTGLEIVPIAPHSLHSRAVVTDPSAVVEVVLNSSLGNRQATMFVDGELIESDLPIRRIVVRTSEEPTLLLRYKSESFYDHAARVFF